MLSGTLESLTFFHSRISSPLAKNFAAVKKINSSFFRPINERSDKSWTFSTTTREAEQISSVANECKNVISFSNFFPGDIKTGLIVLKNRGQGVKFDGMIMLSKLWKLCMKSLRENYSTIFALPFVDVVFQRTVRSVLQRIKEPAKALSN